MDKKFLRYCSQLFFDIKMSLIFLLIKSYFEHSFLRCAVVAKYDVTLIRNC